MKFLGLRVEQKFPIENFSSFGENLRNFQLWRPLTLHTSIAGETFWVFQWEFSGISFASELLSDKRNLPTIFTFLHRFVSYKPHLVLPKIKFKLEEKPTVNPVFTLLLKQLRVELWQVSHKKHRSQSFQITTYYSSCSS